jgi:quercetin dioxygenase-like cupin family protein
MHPVSKSTKKAYRWGNGGIGWPLVETKGLLVVEETLAPGCSEKHHYHNQAGTMFLHVGRGARLCSLLMARSVEINTGMAFAYPA